MGCGQSVRIDIAPNSSPFVGEYIRGLPTGEFRTIRMVPLRCSQKVSCGLGPLQRSQT